jgi:hypothetical protein
MEMKQFIAQLWIGLHAQRFSKVNLAEPPCIIWLHNESANHVGSQVKVIPAEGVLEGRCMQS